MVFNTQYKLSHQLFWVMYLAIGLVCIQSANLHFSVHDHVHQTDEMTVLDHQHSNIPHVCTLDCDTHAAHDSSTETEVDITPMGIIKHVSPGLWAIALVFWTLAIFLGRHGTRLPRHRNYDLTPKLRRSSRRPPLRAPPL